MNFVILTEVDLYGVESPLLINLQNVTCVGPADKADLSKGTTIAMASGFSYCAKQDLFEVITLINESITGRVQRNK